MTDKFDVNLLSLTKMIVRFTGSRLLDFWLEWGLIKSSLFLLEYPKGYQIWSKALAYANCCNSEQHHHQTHN